MITPVTTSLAGLESFGAATWKRFLKVISDEPAISRCLANQRMLRFAGVGEGRNIYTYFPYLFEEPGDYFSKSQLDDLSVAALFLLLHALLVDRMCDTSRLPAENLGAMTLASSTSLLWAWKLLEGAATAESIWTNAFRIYSQYSEAVAKEATALSKGQFTLNEIVQLVAGKSALAKVITNVLFAKREDVHKAQGAEKTLDGFHLSSNLIDDLEDWKADLEQHRFTYLLSQALRLIGEEPSQALVVSDHLMEQIASRLYKGGLLESYLDETENWMEKAYHESVVVGCHRWTEYLVLSKISLSKRNCRIRAGLRRISCPGLTGQPFMSIPARPLASRSTNPSDPEILQIDEAATNALRFFNRKCSPDHGLQDFWHLQGSHNVLVSAEVGCSVELFNRYKADPVAKALLEQLQDCLSDRWRLDGWASGDSPGLRTDSLTTAMAVRLLWSGSGTHRTYAEAGLSHLLRSQNPDGGFARFPSNNTSSDCDTTAEVVSLLAFIGFPTHQTALMNGRKALVAMGQGTTLWRSTWWSSLSTSSARVLAAFQSPSDGRDAAELHGVFCAIGELQSSDGSWQCPLTGKPSPFETASSAILLCFDDARRYEHHAAKAVGWLLGHQLNDGSWPSRPVLRVPPSECLAQGESFEWSRDPKQKSGVVLHDSSRLFATSVVLRCLTFFQESRRARTHTERHM